MHQEWLEQLQRHAPGQAALVQLELGTDHDDRAASVVDALAQQILAEAALLALEHVGERLQPVAAGAGDWPPAAAVVDQRIDSFLQHALLVADDDLGRAEFDQALEPVVAVDHAAVEVIEVGRGEAATVELDHRSKVGRQHRQRAEEHPLRRVGRLAETVDDLEPLHRLLATLAGLGLDFNLELLGSRIEVHARHECEDRLSAHLAAHDAGVALHQLFGALLGQNGGVEVAGRDRVNERDEILANPRFQLFLRALLNVLELLAQALLLLGDVFRDLVLVGLGDRVDLRDLLVADCLVASDGGGQLDVEVAAHYL